jgi:hypothetical protein
LRQGGINPCQESGQEVGIAFSKKNLEDQKKLEDSDDDYSFEDIYAAASQKVKEREKAKMEEEKMKQLSHNVKIKEEKNTMKKKSDDPTIILKETKEMIASLMGQLPGKFIQKKSGSPGSRKDSPAVQGFPASASLHRQKDLSVEAESLVPSSELGQKIQALGSETAKMTTPVQAVPTLDCSRRMYQNYSNRDPSYNSQYGGQQSFPSSMQTFPGNSHQSFPGQQPAYSGVSYGQNSGYYDGSAHQQYSQHNYSEVYPQQGPSSGGWNNYPEPYGQQLYQTQSATQSYSQYPNQSSGYY